MAFGSFAWTGASGQQIGFKDEKPYSQYGPSFTTDEVHGQAYNPNTPNMYAQVGEIGDVPVEIQSSYHDYSDGYGGWILDNIHDPWHDDKPGTTGHNPPMGGHRRRLDPAHGMDVYQLDQPTGYGRRIYDGALNDQETYWWQSSSKPNPNNGAFPAQAREDTHLWPEPFDSYTVAARMGVPRPLEHINMNRMVEDDRPVYRQLAVPAQNIKPSGSVYNPTYQSNPPVHNVKPLPAFGRTPVVPWTQDELASASDNPNVDSDIFGGMALQ